VNIFLEFLEHSTKTRISETLWLG